LAANNEIMRDVGARQLRSLASRISASPAAAAKRQLSIGMTQHKLSGSSKPITSKHTDKSAISQTRRVTVPLILIGSIVERTG
jgi:hypothetical protein